MRSSCADPIYSVGICMRIHADNPGLDILRTVYADLWYACAHRSRPKSGNGLFLHMYAKKAVHSMRRFPLVCLHRALLHIGRLSLRETGFGFINSIIHYTETKHLKISKLVVSKRVGSFLNRNLSFLIFYSHCCCVVNYWNYETETGFSPKKTPIVG